MMTISDRTCIGSTRQGDRCRGRRVIGSEYCNSHNPTPEARAKMDDARRRGGRNRSTLARLRQQRNPLLRQTADFVFGCLQEVHAGTLDYRVGQAIASLGRALVVLETGAELELRILRLEREMSHDSEHSEAS
jgi:hypothetical protein